MQGELFEWIVVSGKKDYCLTEQQFKILSENKGIVVFDNFAINSSYVSSAYKQKAKRLRLLYRCTLCSGNGVTYKQLEDGVRGVDCDNCNNTGVDLKQKADVKFLLEDGS